MRNRMKRIAFLWLFVSFLTVSLAQFAFTQGKYSLAVLNLRAENNFLSPSETRLISSHLARELSRESLFYTMSQAEMERLLLAASQDPAVGCNTLDCAFEAGETLRAQVVIYGTIRPAGSKITVEAHLVHVRGREVVKSFGDDISADFSQLSAEMRVYTKKFLGLPVAGTGPETEKANAPSPPKMEPPRRMPPPQRRETAPPPAAQPVETPDPGSEPFEPELDLLSEPEPEAVHQDTPVSATDQQGELEIENSGKSRWTLVGIGVLVAGGVSAGLLLAPGNDSGSNVGGGDDTGPPVDPVDDLPDPPNFP